VGDVNPRPQVKSYKDAMAHSLDHRTPTLEEFEMDKRYSSLGLWNEALSLVMECSWEDNSQSMTNSTWCFAVLPSECDSLTRDQIS
jgi:hypothetical protein